MSERIRLGISHGDINGISYEVIIKALIDNRILDLCIPIIYGSPKVAAYHRKAIDLESFNLNTVRSAAEAHPKRVNIINCVDEEIRVELGKSTPHAGESSYLALKAAVDDLENGAIDALVTGPINKHNIQSNSFKYSGHTEYLQARFRVDDVVMLMVKDDLRVGVVTGHVPVASLSQSITKDLIVSKLEIIADSLLMDFGIRKPRIAVLGLNPHAGDEGLLGDEEQRVIIPAIKKAREMDILAFGPFPADGFFGSGNYRKFDAVLAMYHDQGLIPFKTLAQDEGVNYTAGLPVIRTSPAHGTAYELAGKNEASEQSFRNAIYMACDIVKQRIFFKEISKNPLPTGQLTVDGEDESLEDLMEN
ncbi:MAG: 4-hydroxythreonine-4-phosphate dehydrogenase PdxA [Bacteroidota bacterium]